MNDAVRIAAIDALLPQTQCGKCGHPGCQPYAEGIAAGEAINKCPPGGTATIEALANLLHMPALPLALPEKPAQIAVIREDECIGCTKCIQACPVDAIVGAAKLMHTVITDECSGCELCLAPCPVDCIDLITLAAPQAAIQRQRADQFRARHQARLSRLGRDDARRRAARSTAVVRPKLETAATPVVDDQTAQLKRLKIDAAMAKVAYEKARTQVAMHPDSPFAAQLDALQRTSEQATAALQALQNQTGQAHADKATNAEQSALKKAKIEVAGRRAALLSGERRGVDEAMLNRLRADYAAAQQALQNAEQQCDKPAAQRVLVDKAALSVELRQLKTDLAYARAAVSRLQRSADTDEHTLNAALERLAAAEHRLQAHTSAT